MRNPELLQTTRKAQIRTLRRFLGGKPIIRGRNRFLYHDQVAVHLPIEQCFEQIPKQFRTKLRNSFSCYLALTSAQIAPRPNLDLNIYADSLAGFIGAIYCNDFIELSSPTKYSWVKALIEAFQYAPVIGIKLRHLRPSTLGPTEAIGEQVQIFQNTPLCVREAEYWYSWSAPNAKGDPLWLPFPKLYRKFGRNWTRTLFSYVKTWLAGRHATTIPVLSEFCDFLSDSNYLAEDLKSANCMHLLWEEFWSDYGTRMKNTQSSNTIIVDWYHHWCDFVKTALVSSGLFAHADNIDGPDAAAAHSVNTRGDATPKRHESDCKLLVDVPLSAGDRKALDLLLVEIPQSLNTIDAWCKASCAETMCRYLHRRRLRTKGQVRQFPAPKHVGVEEWKLSRNNPEHLANASATLDRYGLSSFDEIRLNELYPVPLAVTAYELALPTRATLLPFAAGLVALHPELTPSMLENLTLWDERGKLRYFYQVNSDWYLECVKLRSGKKAWTRIKLERRSKRLILQILLITREARKRLIQDQSDEWRFLFIDTSKGFGKPGRLKKFSSDTSRTDTVREIAKRFCQTSEISNDAAIRLATKFSLRTLRTTVALGRALKAWSEDEFSKALGHSQPDPKLLRRYIPDSLISYFHAREIRRFQNCLILHATEGTAYQLKATGFASIEQMEEFLDEQALPELKVILATRDNPQTIAPATGSFLAVASESAFFCWATLSKRNSQNKAVGLPATSLGEIGERILAFVETRRGIDPSIDDRVDEILKRVQVKEVAA